MYFNSEVKKKVWKWCVGRTIKYFFSLICSQELFFTFSHWNLLFMRLYLLKYMQRCFLSHSLYNCHIINISLFPHLVILFNHKNKTYSMIPIIKETSPATISLIRHFLLFIFYSKARESLSNCIDSSAIMDDFLSAVSNSVILDTILFTFPLIMSYSSITLLLSASTLLLALYILIKSSIFTFILSFSFGML